MESVAITHTYRYWCTALQTRAVNCYKPPCRVIDLKSYIIFCLQSGFLNSFPFDPLGLNSPANQVKEIKNGRLAMVKPLSVFILKMRHCSQAVLKQGHCLPQQGLERNSSDC